MYSFYGYDTDTSHIVADNAHSGNYAAALTQGAFPLAGALMYQLFSVSGDEATTFDFWAKTTGAGKLTISVNGVPVPSADGLIYSGGTDYAEYQFTVESTQSSYGGVAFRWDSLELGSTLYLDDVLVTQGAAAVPEPTTIISGGMLLLPFGAGALRLLPRRKAA